MVQPLEDIGYQFRNRNSPEDGPASETVTPNRDGSMQKELIWFKKQYSSYARQMPQIK